jgi:anti-sigma factor RsiW
VGLFGLFSCKDCVDALLSYVEGEMPAEQRAKFEGHLGACPPCVDFLNTYRETPTMCRKALAKRMPPELSSKLKELLRTKT